MRLIILSAIMISALFISADGFTQEHHHGVDNGEETQSIIKIMQGMNENIHKLTSAILFEDFPFITSSAHDIANHPGIDKHDLHQLFERLGERKDDFIACDTAVHNLAKDIAVAGKQENMELVLEKYFAMITKTVECHKEYKPKHMTGNEE